MSQELSFFESVYEVARLIPPGRVSTYGAIAAAIGAKKAARMVGYAMNNAHIVQPKVPAHRVVNRKGLLTGKHHFENDSQMEKLLAQEGVLVKNNQVVEFSKLFWDPLLEI